MIEKNFNAESTIFNSQAHSLWCTLFLFLKHRKYIHPHIHTKTYNLFIYKYVYTQYTQTS